MDDNVEPLNQVLLERLEPLVNTVERQLRDLGQGQVFLHSHVAELTSELALSQAEFDKIHDTFSRLPHYIAKLAAIRNTINTATIHSKKIKKRSELVISGREKQEARSQVSRAKERAYDKTIVASVSSAELDNPGTGNQGTTTVTHVGTFVQRFSHSDYDHYVLIVVTRIEELTVANTE
ncbi:hypothetical protein BGW38_009817 [Lunasporangiospora selenospora]|uniref:Uncharacterized protein n=1 Tax=Lunasporangiospora selenospora TaxID=979761 RepID=A0A9P6KFZ5_9FUNG|nr:hypothetical protein BGW38_009817 [Lunasporangiospora selenospora]